MTYEEAKIYLRNWRNAIESRGDTDFSDAICSLNMAIQALESIDKIKAERNAAVEDIKKNWLCFTCKKRIKGREWAYCKHLELEVTGRDDARTTTCENWEWRGISGAFQNGNTLEAMNAVPATDWTGRCYVGNCPKCGGNVILRRPE